MDPDTGEPTATVQRSERDELRALARTAVWASRRAKALGHPKVEMAFLNAANAVADEAVALMDRLVERRRAAGWRPSWELDQ